MVVLDWAEHKGGDLNQFVTIPPSAFVGTLENNIGFRPGDEIALRDLLYAALVQSDNIAAYALASYVGSQIQAPTAEAFGGRHFRHPDERAGQAIKNGKDALRESARGRHEREAVAVFDRRRCRATHSLRAEQGELSLLRFAKGTPDLVAARRKRATLLVAQHERTSRHERNRRRENRPDRARRSMPGSFFGSGIGSRAGRHGAPAFFRDESSSFCSAAPIDLPKALNSSPKAGSSTTSGRQAAGLSIRKKCFD